MLVVDSGAVYAVVDGAMTDGRTTKADVVENDKQTKARRRDKREEKLFMVV